MKRYALALDLKEDPHLIAEYILAHKNVWPEIIDSIKESGILNMEIFNIENRLFMIMETDDTFSFENKGQLDHDNPKVQEWEQLMWKYQQALPHAKRRRKVDAYG